MKLRMTLGLLAAAACTAPATKSLAPAGRMARATEDAQLVSWCKPLGEVEGKSTGKYSSRLSARAAMLQAASARGATTVLLVYKSRGVMSILLDPNGTYDNGQAFDCTLVMAEHEDSVAYSSFARGGGGAIVGQAFLTTRGGDVRMAAGRTVTLDPGTAYAIEWYRKIGTDLYRIGEYPPGGLFPSARRVTTADAQGRFAFDRLAPGLYIVRAPVTWEAGVPLEMQGGIVSDTVRVGGGERREIVLSRSGVHE